MLTNGVLQMKEKWRIVINGEPYNEETVRANWAIRKALQRYKDQRRVYSMTKELTIQVTRGNGKPFPTSKVV